MAVGSDRRRQLESQGGGKVRDRQLAGDIVCETEPEWTSEGRATVDERLSPRGRAGPPHRRARAQAPPSLPRSGSRSWSASASGTREGRARNPGVPAARPGPAAAVRPAAARSAGGPRGPPPSFPPCRPPSLARSLSPLPPSGSAGPLPAVGSHLVAQRGVGSMAQQ